MCDISGLFVYLGSLILILLSVLLVKKYKYFSFLLFLLVGVIAVFRGTAGVDTRLYITRFESIGSIYDISFVEPLISLLMWMVKSLGGSFPVFSILYAVILTILFYFILRRFPNAIYFGVSMLPVIYIDSLYNGVRVGLAYPLLFLAIAFSSVSILVIAALGHISALLAGLFKVFSLYHYVIILCVLIAAILFPVFLNNLIPSRYIYKIDTYQDMSPHTKFAGFADSAAFWVALIIYYRVSISRKKDWIFFCFLSFILVGIVYYFIINNYVGMLRIVRLLAISVFGLIARDKSSFDRDSFLICSFFGIIYSANFLRQICASCSYDEGGFLPLNLTWYF